MSVENLNSEFEKWNPMEKDYKNYEFNQYNTGPGANLDSALQSCQQSMDGVGGKTTVQKDAPIPYLLFKNMPPKMTKSALFNICSKHGKVTAVRDSQKCDYFFADFATVADMESTFRALENNNYGFKVFVGRHNNKKQLPKMDYSQDNKIITVPPRTIGVDYESRTYRVSSKQNPRPIIPQHPLIEGEYINGLPSDIINSDAHHLEREGCYEPMKHNKFKYHTGRSYVFMPDHTRDFVNKKHGESLGHYSPSTGRYANKSVDVEKPCKIGKCIQCERECDTICSRCSVYYCSMYCQKNDWQNHRFVCGKPKHLHKRQPTPRIDEIQTIPPKSTSKHTNSIETCSSTDATKTTTSATDVEYKPQISRSGNIVTMTAISKTNIVFIRSKTYEDNMSYFKTVGGLQAIGKRLKPVETIPKCGTVVVAKFENQFNRAMVLNSDNPDKIFIHYMDYGNLDNLRMDALYEAPIEYVEKPRHAIPVILKDVPDCYMTEEIRNFMYSYLNGVNVYVKYKPEDYLKNKHVYQVELIDESTQQNLNKIIIKLSKPTEPLSTNEICYREYLEQKILPSGENVELVVMDNSLMSTGCISCTTKPYAFEIQKFQTDLQKYVEGVPKEGYAPRVDELCIVKYKEDGLWYRGRCLEIVGDGHPTILFIDYGNISIVHIDDIRRYPTQFTYPIYTADCEIQGLPESCSTAVVAKLEELIPHGSIIKCKHIKAFDDDYFYSVSLPDVIQKLRESGLL